MQPPKDADPETTWKQCTAVFRLKALKPHTAQPTHSLSYDWTGQLPLSCRTIFMIIISSTTLLSQWQDLHRTPQACTDNKVVVAQIFMFICLTYSLEWWHLDRPLLFARSEPGWGQIQPYRIEMNGGPDLAQYWKGWGKKICEEDIFFFFFLFHYTLKEKSLNVENKVFPSEQSFQHSLFYTVFMS